MRGSAKDLATASDLDDPTGVHHGNVIDELGDDRKVVRDENA